jgi:NADPH2:quinone reductase
MGQAPAARFFGAQTLYSECMRIVSLDHFGGPEVLLLSEAPQPQPGPGELLIRVAAAGLNRADLHQRQGNYPPPPGASQVLGLEVAGTIAETGPSCPARWKVGDPVCALVPGGGYAEYCVADCGCCLPIPDGLSLEQAAALPEAAFTVFANLFSPVRLNAGDRFLVQGGTSGIGTFAIQAARAFGGRPISTAGSEEKCRFLLELGCEQAWDYRRQDWFAAAKEWAPSGIDVILDMVGGDYFPKHIDLLARDGRLVHIAFSRGSEVTLDLRKLMSKRLIVTGSTLRSRSVEEKTPLRDGVEKYLWPLISAKPKLSREEASDHIRPMVDRVFPMADAAAAHRYMDSGQHIGKIVLRIPE